jgi:hypothetical protein
LREFLRLIPSISGCRRGRRRWRRSACQITTWTAGRVAAVRVAFVLDRRRPARALLSVVIGAGGAAGGSTRGANGANSSALSVTATGGGGGGGGTSGSSLTGAAGGSGGGGRGISTTAGSGGTGTQGSAGGAGFATTASISERSGGGGGGGIRATAALGCSMIFVPDQAFDTRAVVAAAVELALALAGLVAVEPARTTASPARRAKPTPAAVVAVAPVEAALAQTPPAALAAAGSSSCAT